MSNDKDKLIAILNELEKDYHDGNISREKYAYLRERYIYKIETLDASNRIRSMQGKENHSPNSRGNSNRMSRQNLNSHEDYSNNQYMDNNPRHYDSRNRRNVNNMPRRPNDYNDSKNAQNKSKKSGIAIGVLFTVVLLFAFGAGIAMGIFNMDNVNADNGITGLIESGASINDTAFPIVKKNITTNVTTNYNSSYNTSYSSTNYSYDGGSSSYDSGGSSSYDSGGDSSYDSGGSSSYDSGGSNYYQ